MSHQLQTPKLRAVQCRHIDLTFDDSKKVGQCHSCGAILKGFELTLAIAQVCEHVSERLDKKELECNRKTSKIQMLEKTIVELSIEKYSDT